MKTILMVVILQAVAPGQGESAPTAQVMSSLAAEFDSKEACLNAAKGMTQLGGGAGFMVVWGCAPKDMGKVEPEKPKRSPSGYQAQS